jgi:hypothetical protein
MRDLVKLKFCTCGSNKQRRALYDARGIFCTYVCDDCEQRKMKGFRPEIFTDPRYETDEPIDEDE